MDLTPTPTDRFAFGLWTVGHPGRDPFGDATRPLLEPAEVVLRLADLGAWGVSFHDDDLLPPHLDEVERGKRVASFRRALDTTGMVVSMCTTNLFWHPVFKDGAYTSTDPDVRRLAISKTLRGIELAAEFGAPIYVFWGGREGVESFAAKDPFDALDRYREALNFLTAYVRDRGYDMQFALEPKPNEPRGDTFLPTVGHMLSFIETLDDSEMVGVNPEVAHETMSGLSMFQGVAQALWMGKLFHIDLNAQKIGRYDQDLRFGSEGIKDAFFLVDLLERSGYAGPKHFDARPYRTDRDEGIWDFASGCMRTYLALADAAAGFREDPEVLQALEGCGQPELAKPTVGPYDAQVAAELLSSTVDLDRLASRNFANERLDQLVIDHILGIR